MRMSARRIRDLAGPYPKLAAAHAAMVDSPRHHVALHCAIAERALVHHLLCHDAAVFDPKSVAAMPAVIYLARTHKAADGSRTKRTYVVECVVLVPSGVAFGARLLRGACTAARSRGHFATCVDCGYGDPVRLVR